MSVWLHISIWYFEKWVWVMFCISVLHNLQIVVPLKPLPSVLYCIGCIDGMTCRIDLVVESHILCILYPPKLYKLPSWCPVLFWAAIMSEPLACFCAFMLMHEAGHTLKCTWRCHSRDHILSQCLCLSKVLLMYLISYRSPFDSCTFTKMPISYQRVYLDVTK